MSTVCDKCQVLRQATQVIIIEAEDERHDLCEKHMVELQNWLATKEKSSRRKKRGK